MAADSASVILFDVQEHAHLTPYLAAIHASCITHDHAIATFVLPLSHEKLLAWWKERIAEVADGTRLIFLLLARRPDESGSGSGRVKGPEVMGVVMLVMPRSETGRFRGLVEKLLVHKNFRRRGGARMLIKALEEEASRRQRTLLLSDTETDSPGEAVYKKLGFIEMGRIPNFGISPAGEPKDGAFFYKDISAQTCDE